MLKRIYPKTRGFGLLEIVIVAGMVGLLGSVVVVNVSEARKVARDTQREADLAQLALALRMYSDVYGSYKISGAGEAGEGVGWISYVSDSSGDDGGAITLPPPDDGYILPVENNPPNEKGGGEEITPDFGMEAQIIRGIPRDSEKEYEFTGKGKYEKSITQALFEKGYLPVPSLNDPKPVNNDLGYFLLLCDGGMRYALFATKEIPNTQEIEAAKSMCDGEGAEIVAQFGKNYAIGN